MWIALCVCSVVSVFGLSLILALRWADRWIHPDHECIICGGECRYRNEEDTDRVSVLPPDIF